MYDPDTYRRYKAPDNVIPPSIGLVTSILYTLMFQSVILLGLAILKTSNSWLLTSSGKVEDVRSTCVYGDASAKFEESMERYNDLVQSLDQQSKLKARSKIQQNKLMQPINAFTNSTTNHLSNRADIALQDWVEPTFDAIRMGPTSQCMESYTSSLELALENHKFLNAFNPLLIFEQNFTQITNNHDFIPYVTLDDTMPFITALIPGIPGPFWQVCSKCGPQSRGIYSSPQNVLFISMKILGVSMLFLICSALSAKKFHDSHGLAKMTALLASMLQVITTVVLILSVGLMVTISDKCQSKWRFPLVLTFILTLTSFIPTVVILVVVARYRKISYEGM